MCVPCVSAIEIQTTGPISMKFGMSILLNGGKVRSWDLTPYPSPGVRGALNRVLHALQPNCVTWQKTYKSKVKDYFIWG